MNLIPTEMKGEKRYGSGRFKDRVRTRLFVLGGETSSRERNIKEKRERESCKEV